MSDTSPSGENGPPEVGDDVELIDTLSSGDVVYFERVEPTRVLVHAMTTDMFRSYKGPLFILDLGDRTGCARFVQVPRDQVE